MAKEKPKIAQKPRVKSTHRRDTRRGMRGMQQGGKNMRRTRLKKPAAIPVEQYQINEGLHTVLLCPYCCEFVADD
jgi:hypothetical protein